MQRNTSTQQQLLIYFHQLITLRKEIDTIYIDFYRKAFDCVPHNELLTWFNCYFKKQIPVCLCWKTAVKLLGPLLFLIFIKDLPSTISLNYVLEFADDAKCFRQMCFTLVIQQLHEDRSLLNISLIFIRNLTLSTSYNQWIPRI